MHPWIWALTLKKINVTRTIWRNLWKGLQELITFNSESLTEYCRITYQFRRRITWIWKNVRTVWCNFLEHSYWHMIWSFKLYSFWLGCVCLNFFMRWFEWLDHIETLDFLFQLVITVVFFIVILSKFLIRVLWFLILRTLDSTCKRHFL